MIWLLGTFPNGETLEYGVPLTEPIAVIEMDKRHFVSIDILEIQTYLES